MPQAQSPGWYMFHQGAVDKYVITAHGSSSYRRSGMLVNESAIKLSFTVSQRVESINQRGTAEFVVTYEDIDVRLNETAIPVVSETTKQDRKGSMQVGGDGTVKSLRLPEAAIPGVYQGQYGFSLMYVPFPEKKVSGGESWNANYNFTVRQGEDVLGEEIVKGTYTLVGYETYLGCKCAKIEIENQSVGSLVAHGKPLRRSESTAHGFIYFDVERGRPIAQTLELSWRGYPANNTPPTPLKTSETIVKLSLDQQILQ